MVPLRPRGAIKLNSKLIKANFNGLRTIHNSAFLRCILPESAIRHTHVRPATIAGAENALHCQIVIERERACALELWTNRCWLLADRAQGVPVPEVATDASADYFEKDAVRTPQCFTGS